MEKENFSGSEEKFETNHSVWPRRSNLISVNKDDLSDFGYRVQVRIKILDNIWTLAENWWNYKLWKWLLYSSLLMCLEHFQRALQRIWKSVNRNENWRLSENIWQNQQEFSGEEYFEHPWKQEKLLSLKYKIYKYHNTSDKFILLIYLI